MQLLAEYGLFLAKTITFIIAILLVAGGLVSLIARARTEKGVEHLELKKIKTQFTDLKEQILETILTKKEYKKWLKSETKKEKEQDKESPAFLF
jgi:serine protease SohB